MTIHSIDELATSSMPLVGNVSGIYFLFDGNEPVYIGQGWNCLLRVAEHTRRDTDKNFTSWNFVRIDEEADRKRQEKVLIQRYKPKFNKMFS
jgi:excinuclease UvrABC nuclease subunit